MSTFDDLHDQRLALMDGIVHALAAERGIDTSQGLSQVDRHRLAYEAELLVEDWLARLADGEIIVPTTPVEMLLAELYDVDSDLIQAKEGRTGRAEA